MKAEQNVTGQQLVDQLVELDKKFVARLDQDDTAGAMKLALEGAEITWKLRWLLGKQAALVGSKILKDFVHGEIQLIQIIDELGLSSGLGDDTWEWADQHGWIADEHLNEIIDLENPDWPDAVNQRLLQVDVLITKTPLPEWVLRHLRSVRRCYAFKLYDVVWISLRSLIETASFACLIESGILPADERVLPMARLSIRDCLSRLRQFGKLSRSDKTIDRIIDRANELVHSKRKIEPPSERETLTAIKKVIQYVDALVF